MAYSVTIYNDTNPAEVETVFKDTHTFFVLLFFWVVFNFY